MSPSEELRCQILLEFLRISLRKIGQITGESEEFEANNQKEFAELIAKCDLVAGQRSVLKLQALWDVIFAVLTVLRPKKLNLDAPARFQTRCRFLKWYELQGRCSFRTVVT